MRILATVLISLTLLGWTSGASVAQQAAATAEVPRYDKQASSLPDQAGTGVTAREIAVGGAVLSGVFAVGLIAGNSLPGGASTAGLVAAGSLSGGIVAAGAVALIYTFLQ